MAKIGNLMEMPIVEVVWADASSYSPWHDFYKAVALGSIEARTVGRLAKNDKKHVVVVPTINIEGECATTWTIPKGWVKMVTVLRKGKKPKRMAS